MVCYILYGVFHIIHATHHISTPYLLHCNSLSIADTPYTASGLFSISCLSHSYSGFSTLPLDHIRNCSFLVFDYYLSHYNLMISSHVLDTMFAFMDDYRSFENFLFYHLLYFCNFYSLNLIPTQNYLFTHIYTFFSITINLFLHLNLETLIEL